jgi:hypothetical protein
MKGLKTINGLIENAVPAPRLETAKILLVGELTYFSPPAWHAPFA